MVRNTRRKSRADKTEAALAENIPLEDDIDNTAVETDPNAAIAARKLLKGRLYGRDVPSKFWHSCGLENQKRQ